MFETETFSYSSANFREHIKISHQKYIHGTKYCPYGHRIKSLMYFHAPHRCISFPGQHSLLSYVPATVGNK